MLGPQPDAQAGDGGETTQQKLQQSENQTGSGEVNGETDDNEAANRPSEGSESKTPANDSQAVGDYKLASRPSKQLGHALTAFLVTGFGISPATAATLIDQSRNQELSNGSVKATATFTYRMVAQSPIPVFLDTVRVPWFHTLENTPREAIIPARRINVGLPDRADLLADIALKDNWGARLKFKISSSEIQRAPWYISFSMLLIVCSALGFRELFHSRREFKQHSDGHGAGNLPEL